MGKFTDRDIKYAKEVQEKYNVPASIVLAQYALESGYGTSDLARQNNNYFGMRDGSSGWQKFSSKKDSFMAYGELLSSSLYTDKTKGASNSGEYIDAIAETYAPSNDGNNNYAGQIKQIIKDFDLTKYDSKGVYGSGGSESGMSKAEYGLVWWGDVVKVIFCILVIIGGVVLFGLAVTSNSVGDNLVKKVKTVKKVGAKND